MGILNFQGKESKNQKFNYKKYLVITISFTNFYEFPLAARCSETTKNTVDKVQKRKGRGK